MVTVEDFGEGLNAASRKRGCDFAETYALRPYINVPEPYIVIDSLAALEGCSHEVENATM